MRNLAFVCTFAAMFTIAAAGLLKLLDLATFSRAIGTWTVLPDWARPLLVVAVPMIELAAGGLWLSGNARRSAELVAIAIVVVFTLAYSMQLATAQKPACGCLGSLSRHVEMIESAAFVIVRNLAILAVLSAAILRRYRGGALWQRA